MEDGPRSLSLMERLHGQSDIFSHSRKSGLHNLAGGYINAGLWSVYMPLVQRAGSELDPQIHPFLIQAQAEKEKRFSGFMVDFLMGGFSAAVSKTAAAPID